MSALKNKYIILNPDDNCATALIDISKDTELRSKENFIIMHQNIPMGHKFSLKDVNKGKMIKKYGQAIGIATEDIKKGDWIHTHNLTSLYLKDVPKK